MATNESLQSGSDESQPTINEALTILREFGGQGWHRGTLPGHPGPAGHACPICDRLAREAWLKAHRKAGHPEPGQ